MSRLELANNIYLSKPKRNPSGFLEVNSAGGENLQGFKYHTDQEAQEHEALTLINQGKLKEAEAIYRSLIDIGTQNHLVYGNLATICGLQGNFDELIALIREALKLRPNYPEAHNNMGVALKEQGELHDAITSYNRAIQLRAYYPEAHNNLGNALKEKGELNDAICSYKQALLIKPDYAEAHNNMGNALKEKGRLNAAINSYKKAIQLKPNYPEALVNIGNTFIGKREFNTAIEFYTQALVLKPNYPGAHNNLGNTHQEKGDLEAAIASYEDSLELDKDFAVSKAELIHCKGKACDWSTEVKTNKWLRTLGLEDQAVDPMGLLASEDEPEKHLIRAKRYIEKKHPGTKSKIYSKPKEAIHIGYFSADFRNHPVMHLIVHILELHDRTKFRIYTYDYGKFAEDDLTRRLKESGCIYRDIREVDDKQAAKIARSDGLDIAVDLMGYTNGHRCGIFYHRAAPIQINYLGYPGSSGANYIDYIIADKTLIPEEYEKYYSENIIYMPHCYQCNDDSKEISMRAFERKDLGLPDKAFVFTCFNNNFKITSSEFDIWMRLMKRVEPSVLWLFRSNQFAEMNLKKEAEKRSIDPSRIIFADRMVLNEHLARHSCGDIFLDTFNYNAHTTASDALWSGMPVLTMVGRGFAARVGASLLTALNLNELITMNKQEYEETAYRLATNPNELFSIKARLIQARRASPLFDSFRFTRDLEEKYESVLKR